MKNVLLVPGLTILTRDANTASAIERDRCRSNVIWTQEPADVSKASRVKNVIDVATATTIFHTVGLVIVTLREQRPRLVKVPLAPVIKLVAVFAKNWLKGKNVLLVALEHLPSPPSTMMDVFAVSVSDGVKNVTKPRITYGVK